MSPVHLIWVRHKRASGWNAWISGLLITVRRGRHGGWRWQCLRRWGKGRTPAEAQESAERALLQPWLDAQGGARG